MINKYAQALRNLHPTVHGYSMDFNLPTTQEFLNSITGWPNNVSLPTLAQLQAEVDSVEQELETNAYKTLRQYPSLGDQLDMLWHAIDNGTLNKTSDFYTAIKAVKDAHPKE